MQAILFYLFAALTLLCGALVFANPFTRNPITSAMFLVLTIVSLAGLFVLLHAFFLAAVQILVYAGAVMVLFLFVIMLLDLKEEERRTVKLAVGLVGLAAAGGIAFTMIEVLRRSSVGVGLTAATVEGSTLDLGARLFNHYALPFELISLVLLVAVMGSVLLSKKDLK
jgi:NADH-quinone oxidoreductase subunit J